MSLRRLTSGYALFNIAGLQLFAQEQTMETNTEPIGALAFARKKLAECERRIAQ